MTALALIVAFSLSILVAPLATHAQQPTPVYRIARLSYGSPGLVGDRALEAFRQRLRELGYVEGQNLVIEYHYAEGKPERLANLAAELVRRKVDVIVAMGAAVTRAAQHATPTLPIVMEGVLDPVAQGLVTSMAQPGGNTTGVSTLGTGLPGKRLELLKKTVPQLSRITVLANPDAPAYGFCRKGVAFQDGDINRKSAYVDRHQGHGTILLGGEEICM
jgi:putative ABC transport system substrate-binding protein